MVINALKYAFPLARAGARILVTFEFDGPDWKLAVADNGGGRRVAARSASGGLGTAIVTALAKQLDARLQETSSARGLRVEVLRGVYAAHLPLAA